MKVLYLEVMKILCTLWWRLSRSHIRCWFWYFCLWIFTNYCSFYTWNVPIAALLIMRLAKKFPFKVAQLLTCHHSLTWQSRPHRFSLGAPPWNPILFCSLSCRLRKSLWTLVAISNTQYDVAIHDLQLLGHDKRIGLLMGKEWCCGHVPTIIVIILKF